MPSTLDPDPSVSIAGGWTSGFVNWMKQAGVDTPVTNLGGLLGATPARQCRSTVTLESDHLLSMRA